MPEVITFTQSHQPSLIGRTAEYDDVVVVIRWNSSWRVYHSPRPEYCSANTTSITHCAESDHMGSMLVLQEGTYPMPCEDYRLMIDRSTA